MSGQPIPTPARLETKGAALLARPTAKTLEDADLKSLIAQIDGACAADAGIKLIVIDLSAVSMVPSLTIGLLVQLLNKCRARDQKLTLTGLQPPIRQVFAITKMDRVFRFAATVEAAIA